MRYNIFNQIHKALRAMLYDTALVLQQTHFANPDESESALEKIKVVLDQFDKHAKHEDDFVLPAIAHYEPSLVDAFEQEHVEDHTLAENLRNQVKSFELITEDQKKMLAGRDILHAFIAFMTFNLNHMGREETVLNQRLWRYYTDPELILLSQKILASLPAEEVALSSTWMMRGLSNSEITTWLKAVQTNAPEPVFNHLFYTAEKELSHSRFRKILEDLTEGVMIA